MQRWVELSRNIPVVVDRWYMMQEMGQECLQENKPESDSRDGSNRWPILDPILHPMLVEGMSEMLTKGQAQVHKPIRKHIALSSGLSQSFDMPLKQVVQGIPVDVWKIC